MIKNRFWRIGLTLCVTIMLCSACNRKNKPLPDEDYLGFLQEIITAAYQEVPFPSTFNDAFDISGFAKKIIQIGDILPDSENDLTAFLNEYFKPGNAMIQKVMDGADYQLIKFYWKNDTAHALFRVYDGGINMEDWTLVTHNQRIYVDDIYNVISGLYWSEEWNMNACMYFSVRTDHFFLFEKLIEINRLVGSGEYSQADSLYTWIEQACISNLYAQVLRLNLVSQSQTYDSLANYSQQFLKHFPDKKEIVHFYLMQNAINNGNMPLVDSLSHLLEQEWGKDPIHFLYKAWGYKAAHQPLESKRMLDSLISYMPLVYDFYNYILDIYDEMGDTEGFVRQLEKTDSLFFASKEDIPFYESTYPNMVKNDAYKNWKKKHLVKLAEENQP